MTERGFTNKDVGWTPVRSQKWMHSWGLRLSLASSCSLTLARSASHRSKCSRRRGFSFNRWRRCCRRNSRRFRLDAMNGKLRVTGATSLLPQRAESSVLSRERRLMTRTLRYSTLVVELVKRCESCTTACNHQSVNCSLAPATRDPLHIRKESVQYRCTIIFTALFAWHIRQTGGDGMKWGLV